MPVATGSLGTPRLAIAAAFGVQGLLFISLTTRLPVLADLFDFDELALSGLMLMMVLLAGVGSVGAEAIAKRSIEEMRRVAPFSNEQAERWQAALQAALPDVKPGDTLTGIYRPGGGAVFRMGDKVVGEVADPEFARLFFGIWLSPNTSEPALRQALLASRSTAGSP